jgi:hypothetical protein
MVDFGLGRLVLDSFKIQNLRLPFGYKRRLETGLSALDAFVIVRF